MSWLEYGGVGKELQNNNTVPRDERTLEHGFEKVKITHIPDREERGKIG